MREADIARAVARWLAGQGCEVHGEVQPGVLGDERFDVVGLDAMPEPVVVECKVAYSRDVRFQAARAQRFTPRVYVAVATRPRLDPPPAPDNGWGILRVTGGSVDVLREPAPPPEHSRCTDIRYPAALRSACNRWTRGRLGGVGTQAPGECPTPYRVLVWTLSERMRPIERGLALGEILDLGRDLFAKYRWPRAALRSMLEREVAFCELDDGWVATGLGVPR